MSGKRAVLWGASGAIGQALVEALAASNDYAAIYAGSRSPSDAHSTCSMSHRSPLPQATSRSRGRSIWSSLRQAFFMEPRASPRRVFRL
jgi:NAD(P)-dependent dehydrogenase (short-subunit alcohol dehydrogenase family)